MHADGISKIAVIGAGLMGHGIALEFASAGYEVHLNDVSEDKLQEAIRLIEANDQSEISIHTSIDIEAVVRDVDVVIEAVPENLELKREIFRQLDRLCPEHTILASNTSTLMPSMLAAATQRPDKVLVTHYFNPPHLMPMVEVVRHAASSDETVRTVYDLLVKIGKTPAIINKEVPGFVANRLQFALFREALSLVEQGVASAQDIDTIVKTGFGRRYAAAGPFEIWELAGWDLALAASQYVVPDLNTSKELSPILSDMVEDGKLGAKVGQGFYEWTPDSVEALKHKIGRFLRKGNYDESE